MKLGDAACRHAGAANTVEAITTRDKVALNTVRFAALRVMHARAG